MPCAIVIGCAPVVVFTGPQKLPINQDEMGVAGALAGAPIRIAKCATIDLEVPADSEIVIEGLIDTDLLEPEGPFGESNGYVALEDYNMSMQVTAITHRRSPVFVSIISQVTPSESSMIKKVAYEPLFLAHLREHLSIKGIRRVVMHEPLSNVRPVVFLQFANGTPRTEVWRGLQGAAALRADCGKIVVAVSEDIEPSNTDAVLWSLAYRSNPQDDVHIEPYRSIGHAPKSGPQTLDSTMLIDATLKYPMPPLALPKREFMERALEHLEAIGFAGAARAAALARLFVGRLERSLGCVRLQCRLRRMAKKRPEHISAPPRRSHPGNSRPQRRRSAEIPNLIGRNGGRFAK